MNKYLLIIMLLIICLFNTTACDLTRNTEVNNKVKYDIALGEFEYYNKDLDKITNEYKLDIKNISSEEYLSANGLNVIKSTEEKYIKLELKKFLIESSEYLTLNFYDFIVDEDNPNTYLGYTSKDSNEYDVKFTFYDQNIDNDYNCNNITVRFKNIRKIYCFPVFKPITRTSLKCNNNLYNNENYYKITINPISKTIFESANNINVLKDSAYINGEKNYLEIFFDMYNKETNDLTRINFYNIKRMQGYPNKYTGYLYNVEGGIEEVEFTFKFFYGQDDYELYILFVKSNEQYHFIA